MPRSACALVALLSISVVADVPASAEEPVRHREVQQHPERAAAAFKLQTRCVDANRIRASHDLRRLISAPVRSAGRRTVKQAPDTATSGEPSAVLA